MRQVKSVMLICCVISAVYWPEVNAQSRHVRNKEKNDNFKMNVKVLRREGKCEPKFRLSYISDHQDAEPDVDYSPRAAVLHVCHSTGGCCENARHRCEPHIMEQVQIVFSAKRLGHRKTDYQSFTFTNHTQCVCRE